MSEDAFANIRASSPIARIACIALAVTLTACSGGDSSTGETINGIAVPSEPDTTVNQSTLAGVDSNGNGIRDDVDRMLAREFGLDPTAYQEAVRYAKTQQMALLNPTQASVDAHIALLRCVNDQKKLSSLKKITLANEDTLKRRAAYGQAFAGAVLSDEGCA